MSLSPEEISRLLDSHWGPLVAWVGSTPDAEDIVQQTFVALAGLVSAPNNPRAWLYKAAKNKAINAHKSSKRRITRHKLASKSERVLSQDALTAESSELKSLLEQLPQDQRQVVVARIWGQLTFKEIGRLQIISKARAWRLYNDALETLRKIYDVPCEVTHER